MDLKLPFGMRDGRLVHISEVERGLKCGCLCPSCSHQLVARKGEQVVHHFAHHKGEDCQKSVETALHLAAKQVLEEEKRIRVPEVVVRIGYETYVKLYDSVELKLDEVKLEKRFDDIVPDVLAFYKVKPLIIEVTVTHGIYYEKEQKIRKNKISALEVSLEGISRDFLFDDLKEVVVNGDQKKWIYNTKVENEYAFLKNIAEKKLVIERGFALHVDYCVTRARVWRGKPYANVMDDCSYCEYHFDDVHDSYEERKAVLCLARSKRKLKDRYPQSDLFD